MLLSQVALNIPDLDVISQLIFYLFRKQNWLYKLSLEVV